MTRTEVGIGLAAAGVITEETRLQDFGPSMKRIETKLHRGRKPIGERAMTSTERVQRHRQRKASTS